MPRSTTRANSSAKKVYSSGGRELTPSTSSTISPPPCRKVGCPPSAVYQPHYARLDGRLRRPSNLFGCNRAVLLLYLIYSRSGICDVNPPRIFCIITIGLV